MDVFSGAQKRWYDQDKDVSAAVESILKLPDEIQAIICRGILLLAEKEFKASEQIKNIKSLGTDKVMALYKSKQKKRDYDQKLNTHTAINYLGFLSLENQRFMAKSILDLAGLVYNYMSACKTHQAMPVSAHVEDLTENYLDGGLDRARDFLRQVEKELLAKIDRRQPGSGINLEQIQEQGSDLAVRHGSAPFRGES